MTGDNVMPLQEAQVNQGARRRSEAETAGRHRGLESVHSHGVERIVQTRVNETTRTVLKARYSSQVYPSFSQVTAWRGQSGYSIERGWRQETPPAPAALELLDIPEDLAGIRGTQ